MPPVSSAVKEASAPHRIVIVGGGAGGLELATRLGNKLGGKQQAHDSQARLGAHRGQAVSQAGNLTGVRGTIHISIFAEL